MAVAVLVSLFCGLDARAGAPAVQQALYDQPTTITVRDWLLMHVHLDLYADWDGLTFNLHPPRVLYDKKKAMFVATVEIGLDTTNAPIDKLRTDLTWAAIKIGADLMTWFPQVTTAQYQVEFRKLAWDKDFKPRFDVVADFKAGTLTLR